MISFGQRIVRYIDRFSVWLVYVGMACVAFMMAIGVVDVTSSKLANRPVPGYYELTEVAMVLVIFWSLAYVQRKRKHITMTVATDRMPERARGVLGVVALLAMLFTIIVVTWSGWVYAWSAWQAREYYPAALQFPVYPWKFALVLGGATLALKLITDIVGSLVALVKPRKDPSSKEAAA